jgi:hypothetical protein
MELIGNVEADCITVPSRSFRTRNELPTCVYQRGARYYWLDNQRKWVPLGRSLDRALLIYRKFAVPSDEFVAGMFKALRANAARREIAVQLSLDDLRDMVAEAAGKCSVTGLRWDFRRLPECRARPWIPSVDRRSSAAPYSPENCRIVCAAVNVAMSDYGEAVLRVIAKRMA